MKQVAVIVGGMGAVGQATARVLGRSGYQVVIVHRNTSTEAIASCMETLPTDTRFFQCDVRSSADVARTVQGIIERHKRIDVCIYTAADQILRKRLLDMSEQEFRGQFEASLFGACTIFRHVAPHMREQKSGTLIGITSSVIDDATTSARMHAYAVAKIALRGLLREFHRELAGSGVRVLDVVPEFMDTKMHADVPARFVEMVRRQHPQQRLMLPEDVANAIRELLLGAHQGLDGVTYRVASNTYTTL